MFPYRRNVKKRGKNAPHPRKGAPHTGQGQRIPGSARDLLRLLQPTTKALAQLLVGNSRPSGQLGHARHVLEQAQWLIDERQVDRLAPREREEFLEQFARLKLTIADARDLELEQEDQAASEPEERPARAVVGPERLREMALALSSAQPAVPPMYSGVQPPAPVFEEALPEEPAVEPEPVAAAEPEESDEGRPGPRGQRLRLKRSAPLDAPLS
ncbi:MAG TPA: hypothetical protein VHL31_00060 [Geminicoccus sp.]|jgi:hypothetical protein|uniref:hypothetical protein n=1 Tax=Geminicoccus sp. TaxID=2024832 RepID=UPI002E344B72|nr:hypothetical protein [Geminicoccus sp.]HEX2524686.1 hypothetical protein [Geminicoccus sp.]